MTRLGAAMVAVLLGVAPITGSAHARWSATTVAGAVEVRAAVLSPPTAPSARPRCVVLFLLPQPEITWQPSPTSFVAGYEILRATSPGGPYTSRATVSGATTQYVDSAELIGGQTYYYVVRASQGNWRSVPTAAASVTLPILACTRL